jgi:hypothetical protein
MARKRELIDTGTNAARPSLNPTMSAVRWPRIGGNVPRPRSNLDKATRATEPGRRPKLQRRQLAGKGPLGSLPDDDKKRRSSQDDPISRSASGLFVDG